MTDKDTSDASSYSDEHISWREEQKRTGRYVAAGTAIFLSLLGAYQALIQGTPEYAALFAPAVIMFVYVLWILHASKSQNARLLRMKRIQGTEESVQVLANQTDDTIHTVVAINYKNPSIVVVSPDKHKQLSRSFSIP